jgi:hypothetical protein
MRMPTSLISAHTRQCKGRRQGPSSAFGIDYQHMLCFRRNRTGGHHAQPGQLPIAHLDHHYSPTISGPPLHPATRQISLASKRPRPTKARVDGLYLITSFSKYRGNALMQQIEISLIPEEEALAAGSPSQTETADAPHTARSVRDRLGQVRNPRVHIDYDVGAAAQQVVTITIPAATALVGAWLQARFGRKVRIKVGDVEVEAATLQEVEHLLEQAKAYRAPAAEDHK